MKIIPCFFAVSLAAVLPMAAAEKLKALIVDGHNNHAVWPKSTVMMKQATGKVTQAIPEDFPSVDKPSARGFEFKAERE